MWKKKPFLLVLAAGVFALGTVTSYVLAFKLVAPAPGGPQLEFVGCAILDVGKGKAGETLEGTFEVKNVGSEDLTFQAQTSCNCSRLEPMEGSVEPGGRQQFRIAVRLREKGKDENVIILFTTNDSGQPKARFEVFAHCPTDLIVQPTRVDFGMIPIGTSASRTIRIQKGAVRLQSVTVAGTDAHLAAELKEAGLDSAALEVRLLPSAPGGLFTGTVRLRPGEDADEVVVPVSAQVCRPLLCSPASLLLPVGSEGAKEFNCLVWRLDGQPLAAAYRIEAPDWLRVEDSSPNLEPRRLIRLRVVAELGTTHRTTVRLHFPTFKDPIEVQVYRHEVFPHPEVSKEVKP